LRGFFKISKPRFKLVFKPFIVLITILILIDIGVFFHGVNEEKKQAKEIVQNYRELLQIKEKTKDSIRNINRPSIKPVNGTIRSVWEYRIDPIYKTKKFHYGVDFSAEVGTPVYATADGVVEWIVKPPVDSIDSINSDWPYYGYGKVIVINHGNGYETLYGHLSKFWIRKGSKVKKGDKIGEVGNTGFSTGSHLHYEVIKNGKKVNPANYY
jgi:murein DD-endopeptidase MepM/ murein hydrolase activator NlpD